MTNKRLINIANRLGQDSLPRDKSKKIIPRIEVQNLEGFEHIPELGFYVADEVSMLGKCWTDCEQELQERKSWMLTPSQFWIYYDYCVQNKREIVTKSFRENSEWLDAFLDKEDSLIIRGIKYASINPILKTCGYFERRDIGKHGLPESVKNKGGWHYVYDGPEEYPIRVASRGSDGLGFGCPPSQKPPRYGVRECKRSG